MFRETPILQPEDNELSLVERPSLTHIGLKQLIELSEMVDVEIFNSELRPSSNQTHIHPNQAQPKTEAPIKDHPNSANSKFAIKMDGSSVSVGYTKPTQEDSKNIAPTGKILAKRDRGNQTISSDPQVASSIENGTNHKYSIESSAGSVFLSTHETSDKSHFARLATGSANIDSQKIYNVRIQVSTHASLVDVSIMECGEDIYCTTNINDFSLDSKNDLKARIQRVCPYKNVRFIEH